MIAEVVVVVAGQQRKDQASPQFAEIDWNIVAELTDAVRQQGVGAWIASRQSQQCHRGNERNAILPRAIKSSNYRDAVSTDRYEPMFRHLNAPLRRERHREDFTPCNVPRVIGLGKLRHCESFMTNSRAAMSLVEMPRLRRASARSRPNLRSA